MDVRCVHIMSEEVTCYCYNTQALRFNVSFQRYYFSAKKNKKHPTYYYHLETDVNILFQLAAHPHSNSDVT